MTPALTIGLPFYDAATTLPDAIRSVFAQSFEDWELLLVDDGSTDDSLALARSIRDERVFVHSDGANRQISFRLNQIASLARGEFLARMDADDLMHPERLALQMKRLRGQRPPDVLGTAACTIDARERPLGIRGEEPPGTTAESVLRRGGFVHPSVIARAAWFRRHPYDPVYVRAEDLELWCRTVERSRFESIPLPLHFYREDRVHVAGYLASCATVQRILRCYGAAALGPVGARLARARTGAKALACRALAGIGAEGALLRARNRRLSPRETAEAEQAIRKILGTPVPGLVPPGSVPRP